MFLEVFLKLNKTVKVEFPARIESKTLKKIEELAKEDQCSIAQIVRIAIIQYLKKRKKYYEPLSNK